jgi:hypothetical protein
MPLIDRLSKLAWAPLLKASFWATATPLRDRWLGHALERGLGGLTTWLKVALTVVLALAIVRNAGAQPPFDLASILPGRQGASRSAAVAWSKSKACFVSAAYAVDTEEDLVVTSYCTMVRIQTVVPWAQWQRNPRDVIERVQAKLRASGFDDLEVIPLQAVKDAGAATTRGVTLAWRGTGLAVQTDGRARALPSLDLPVTSWRPTGVAFAPSPDGRSLFVECSVLEDDEVDANITQTSYRFHDARGWERIKE